MHRLREEYGLTEEGQHRFPRMDALCPKCQGMHWPELPPSPAIPQPLLGMLTANNAASKELRQHSRAYNNSVAFASMVVRPAAGAGCAAVFQPCCWLTRWLGAAVQG